MDLVQKARREQWFTGGCCVTCGKPREILTLRTCESCRKRNRDKVTRNRSNELCTCGNVLAVGYRQCSICLATHRRRKAQRVALGICIACKGTLDNPPAKLCSTCYKKAKTHIRSRRHAVIEHYGGQCSCCGERDFRFLEIDHIDNSGSLHRKLVHPSKMCKWLQEQNYPLGFQILCTSCNKAKGNKLTECPHQTSIRAMLQAVAKIPLTY